MPMSRKSASACSLASRARRSTSGAKSAKEVSKLPELWRSEFGREDRETLMAILYFSDKASKLAADNWHFVARLDGSFDAGVPKIDADRNGIFHWFQYRKQYLLLRII